MMTHCACIMLCLWQPLRSCDANRVGQVQVWGNRHFVGCGCSRTRNLTSLQLFKDLGANQGSVRPYFNNHNKYSTPTPIHQANNRKERVEGTLATMTRGWQGNSMVGSDWWSLTLFYEYLLHDFFFFFFLVTSVPSQIMDFPSQSISFYYTHKVMGESA